MVEVDAAAVVRRASGEAGQMTWEPPQCDTLQEQAAMLHELWSSLLAEGFTPHEASHIIMGQPMCECGDAPS